MRLQSVVNRVLKPPKNSVKDNNQIHVFIPADDEFMDVVGNKDTYLDLRNWRKFAKMEF